VFEFEIEDEVEIISDDEFHDMFEQFLEDMADILGDEDANFGSHV
jgi:hypothetical protein